MLVKANAMSFLVKSFMCQFLMMLLMILVAEDAEVADVGDESKGLAEDEDGVVADDGVAYYQQ